MNLDGKLPRPLRRFARSFPARVFAYMVVPLIGLGAFLAVHFVQSQSELLEGHLRREGTTVAGLLAHDVRVGVFAENERLLEEAVEEVVSRSEVVEVAVFSSSRKLLLRRRGTGSKIADSRGIDGRDASRALAQSSSPHVSEEPGTFTFWAPVILQGLYSSQEELYAPDEAAQPGRVGGLVAVMISKRALQENRKAVVTRCLLGGGGLLLVAALATLFAVREASKPLTRLLKQAREVGSPQANEEDDLGILTDTFGHLVHSLREAMARVAALTAGLERDVAERTQELVVANAELSRARDNLEERVRDRTLALETAHRQLLHAEKLSAVGRISASFAHEINNPVFAIRNVLETLRAAPAFNANQRDLAQAAVDECNRVAKLIRDLQGFNRPTNATPTIVQVNQLLDSVLLLCRKELNVRKIALQTNCAPNLPSVLAAPDQLKQVFLNLLTNAMDAMTDEGGTLTISTEATASDVFVKIEDTGAGIPEENLGRVFDPFFTTKPEVKGTGLGLSISHEIIKSHGGNIEVNSRLGEGAVFTIRLPVPKGDLT